MTYPFVELYGQATDQPALGESYLEGAELPKTDLGLEYTIQTGEFSGAARKRPWIRPRSLYAVHG
jgi:hypothetical protein